MNESVVTSLWNGFSRLTYRRRAARIAELTGLDQTSIEALSGRPVTADVSLAESCVENAVGYLAVPMGVAAYMLIDGRDVVVPMAVEETSIIAAASSAAKFFYPHGGVTTRTEGVLSIGQIQIPRMPSPEYSLRVVEAIAANQGFLLAYANEVVSSLAARGGGARHIEGRVLPEMVVVHVYVDTCDAMGANLINQLCEGLKPVIEDVTGEEAGVCILSNLTDTRMSYATARARQVDRRLAGGVVNAYEFATQDPYRAATHNKGILNAIDAVLLATGNDWRAMEAGAHAYASLTGRYRPLSRWRMEGDDLVGEIRLPTAVGTVGGVTKIHPTAQACLKMLGAQTASELGRICAAVGLIQNFAALRALGTVGIVKGHMNLHARNLAVLAGANQEEQPVLVEKLREELLHKKRLTLTQAQTILSEIRNGSIREEAPLEAK
ncbi:MAG TPA: hydroxymethylglutaryl-CoA reductase, degradative [Blastocatellia bacterium]|nr:hydroxymethylglutaryl-CoA reductase, degradative [Blastocatellia bacterium]